MMHISNGIVYGDNPEEPIRVSAVKVLPDRIMLVTFSNGETRLLNATVLEGKAYAPLKDEDVFGNPSVDHGIITWENGGIDCSPEYVYEHSFEYLEPETAP